METFIVLIVLFVAVAVHAGLGFGTALISMPVLTVLLGLPVAAPFVALVMTATILVTLSRDWHHADFRSAGTLLAFSLLGMPLGALLVRDVDVAVGQAGLGVVMLAFSLFRLGNIQFHLSDHVGWKLVAGVSAGCFGTAYNINAVPIAVYGSLAGWPPGKFRGTLQGFFLPSTLMICVTHAGFGLWTWQVFQWFVLAVPVVLSACWIGNRVTARLSPEGFERAVYLLSGVMGAGMIVRALL